MVELTNRPRAREGAVSRLVGNELIIVLPEFGQVKVLNEVASRIWDLCDGMHPVNEIIQLICDEYVVDVEQAAKDVIGFLHLLFDKDLITLV